MCVIAPPKLVGRLKLQVSWIVGIQRQKEEGLCKAPQKLDNKTVRHNVIIILILLHKDT